MHAIAQSDDGEEHVYLFLFPDDLDHLRDHRPEAGDPKVDFNISNAVMGVRKVSLIAVPDVKAASEILDSIAKFYANKNNAEVFTTGPNGVEGN